MTTIKDQSPQSIYSLPTHPGLAVDMSHMNAAAVAAPSMPMAAASVTEAPAETVKAQPLGETLPIVTANAPEVGPAQAAPVVEALQELVEEVKTTGSSQPNVPKAVVITPPNPSGQVREIKLPPGSHVNVVYNSKTGEAPQIEVTMGNAQTHSNCACAACAFQSPFLINMDAVKLAESAGLDLKASITFDDTVMKPEIKRKDGVGSNYTRVQVETDAPNNQLILKSGNQTTSGRLAQFHMHFPAEHVFEYKAPTGEQVQKRYAGEMHYVFKDKDDNIAVMAMMIKEGKANPGMEGILQSVTDVKPDHSDDNFLMKAARWMKDTVLGFFTSKPTSNSRDMILSNKQVDFASLIPGRQAVDSQNPGATLDLLMTQGSLTAPIQGDGSKPEDFKAASITWGIVKPWSTTPTGHVTENVIEMSRDQIQRYQKIVGGTNNRPLQCDDGRPVYQTTVEFPQISRLVAASQTQAIGRG